MTVYEIPLIAAPQTLSITLAGVSYNLTVLYRNDPQQGWVLDFDSVDGTISVHGMPLVTGADLLAQYGYLGIGGQLIVQTDGNADAVPTFANLGQTAHLYFVTPT